MTKPLAKSLHTITVLVNVANHLIRTGQVERNADLAVWNALSILGYDTHDAAFADPHSLREVAMAQVAKLWVITPVRQPSDAELQAEHEDWEAREERWNERAREV